MSPRACRRAGALSCHSELKGGIFIPFLPHPKTETSTLPIIPSPVGEGHSATKAKVPFITVRDKKNP